MDGMCAIINQVLDSKIAKSIKKPIWIIICLGRQMVYGCPRRSNVALHENKVERAHFNTKQPQL